MSLTKKGYEPDFGTLYLSAVMTPVYILSIFKFIHHDARPSMLDTNVVPYICDPTYAYPNDTTAFTLVAGLWLALQYQVKLIVRS